MPWRVFVGSMLTMLSLLIAFLLNYTVLGQPYRSNMALHPIATILSIVLLVLGMTLVFMGLKKMESK